MSGGNVSKYLELSSVAFKRTTRCYQILREFLPFCSKPLPKILTIQSTTELNMPSIPPFIVPIRVLQLIARVSNKPVYALPPDPSMPKHNANMILRSRLLPRTQRKIRRPLVREGNLSEPFCCCWCRTLLLLNSAFPQMTAYIFVEPLGDDLVAVGPVGRPSAVSCGACV